MLIDAKTIEGFKIHAKDGVIGEVHDILFDDAAWTVRYLVVNTGPWFNRERVLLSPECVADIDNEHHELLVSLTRQQVKDSPDISTNQPVSRQEEERLRSYYAWPVYWGAGGVGLGLDPTVSPAVMPDASAFWTTRPSIAERAAGVGDGPAAAYESEPAGDPHLRSLREVRDYAIAATDGDIGHVQDLLVDDTHWTVHQLVVDTRNWLPGRKVAVAPDQIRDVRWSDHTVTVGLTKEQIERAPEPAMSL